MIKIGNQLIVKGSTIQLGSGLTELKAIVIEDFDIAVGLGTQESDTATDGTKYTYTGEDEDSQIELPILLTDDTFIDVMTEIYGAPTITTPLGIPSRVWDMKSAGTANTALVITTPATSDSYSLAFTAVNPKGLGMTITSNIGKGYTGKLAMACDYFQSAYLGTPA